MFGGLGKFIDSFFAIPGGVAALRVGRLGIIALLRKTRGGGRNQADGAKCRGDGTRTDDAHGCSDFSGPNGPLVPPDADAILSATRRS